MSTAADPYERTEVRDGMRITWHQRIAMSDGIVLRADVYRPVEDMRCPVIMTYGIYAKGLSYQEGYPLQWNKMVEDYPEILEGSSNKYQNWETTDPERWVPHGYAIVRIDSRGAGWSPGIMDPGCAKEIDDLYECIEWAGTQAWSNGKVGMLGISYYASNQWRVAGLHPKHLAAIIPWEGQNDRYRDSGYHGGILCQFQERWAKHQVVNVQYGRGDKAKKNPNTGESVAGPVTLSDEELAKNRINPYEDLKLHPFDDAWHRARQGQPHDATAYKAFLKEIGYLMPEGADFSVETTNVDPEIARIPEEIRGYGHVKERYLRNAKEKEARLLSQLKTTSDHANRHAA